MPTVLLWNELTRDVSAVFPKQSTPCRKRTGSLSYLLVQAQWIKLRLMLGQRWPLSGGEGGARGLSLSLPQANPRLRTKCELGSRSVVFHCSDSGRHQTVHVGHGGGRILVR